MWKHIPRVILLALLVFVAIGFYFTRPDKARLPVDAVAGVQPKITPARDQVFPTIHVPKAVGWPAGAMPQPAAGLKVQAFAGGLDSPRWLYTLPNGDVLVAEATGPAGQGSGVEGMVLSHIEKRGGVGGPSANRITLLRDSNGDGVADQRRVLVSGLNSPFGMALVGDQLYVADTDALLRFPFHVGDTRITARPEKIIDLPTGGHHWTRNVIAAPDGKLLYVAIGSTGNIDENGLDADKYRANVLEVNPATKTARIFAAGMRNPVGMAFDPTSHRLWAAVQERDMAGSDLPPDYMSALEIGDFFGWPYTYWGGYVDKRVPERPDLQPYTKRPDFALGPHVAVLGLAFSNGSALGPNYGYGTFVAEHGSWNRVPASGYRVVYVPFAASGFPARGTKPQDVLTGFLDADGHAMGRPAGLALDKSGALLVADDAGGRVWRVSAAAPAQRGAAQ